MNLSTSWIQEKMTQRLILIYFLITAIKAYSFKETNDYVQPQNLELKQVLYINSYASAFSWADSVTAGINRTFKEKPEILLYTEFLDSKRFKKKLFPSYYELFKSKYETLGIDLVIVSDNNALNFLLEYEDIFKDIPVVFCGIEDPESFSLDKDRFFGIKEEAHEDKMLQLILQVLPDVETFYFLYDSTETSQVKIKIFQQLEMNYRDLVSFEFIYNDRFENTLNRVKQFNKNGAIALTDLYFNKPEDPINIEEALVSLSHVSPVPIFGGRFVSLGKGIVGGAFINGAIHGRKAALLAIKMLDDPTYRPNKNIISEEPWVAFDYGSLDKYDINIDRIPEGSQILNQPDSLKAYLKYVVILLGFILFQGLVITYLVRNIRLRKKAETNLKNTLNQVKHAQREAEESYQLKTEFIHNLTHEIRTPMNGIIGFSDMIAAPDLAHEKRKEFSEIIQESSHQLLSIIDDILDISNLESNQKKYNESDINLNMILEEIYVFYQPRVRDKGIEFIANNELKEEKIVILSDPDKLNKLISKLLENSIKFTENGFIELGCHTKENRLHIYVKDSGIGISEAAQDFIFEKFRQESDGIAKNYGGLGIGLSIVKETASIIGAEIFVTSKKDEGSTFTIVLPLEGKEDYIGEISPRYRNHYF